MEAIQGGILHASPPPAPDDSRASPGTNKRRRKTEHFARCYNRLKESSTALTEETRVQRQQLADKDAECCILATKYQVSQEKLQQLQRDQYRMQDPGNVESQYYKLRYDELMTNYESGRECNARLKAQVSTFQREKLHLQERYNALAGKDVANLEYHQRQHDATKYQLQQKTLELETLRRQLDETQYQLDQKTLELENVQLRPTQTTLDELKLGLQEMNEKNKRLADAKDITAKELQHSQSKLATVLQTIETLTQQRERSNTNFRIMRLELKKYQTKHASVCLELDSLRKESANVTCELQAKTVELTQNQAKLQSVYIELDTAKTEMAESARTMQVNNSEELLQCQANLESVNKELESTKNELAESNCKVRAKDDELVQRRATLQHALSGSEEAMKQTRAALKETRRELLDSNIQAVKMEKAHAELIAKLHSVSQELDTAKKEGVQNTRTMQGKSEELLLCQANLESISQELVSTKNKLTESNGKVRAKDKELVQCRATLQQTSDCEECITRIRAELKEVRHELLVSNIQAEKKNREYTEIIAQLRSKLEEVGNEKAKTEELLKNQAKLKSVTQELETAQSELAENYRAMQIKSEELLQCQNSLKSVSQELELIKKQNLTRSTCTVFNKDGNLLQSQEATLQQVFEQVRTQQLCLLRNNFHQTSVKKTDGAISCSARVQRPLTNGRMDPHGSVAMIKCETDVAPDINEEDEDNSFMEIDMDDKSRIQAALEAEHETELHRIRCEHEDEIQKLRDKCDRLQQERDSELSNVKEKHEKELQQSRAVFKQTLQKANQDHESTFNEVRSCQESIHQALSSANKELKEKRLELVKLKTTNFTCEESMKQALAELKEKSQELMLCNINHDVFVKQTEQKNMVQTEREAKLLSELEEAKKEKS